MCLLQNASFIISANHLNELPEDEGLEIAFAGRSNAGKSSAINTLSKQNKLAFVSKQPGRTQLINFFSIDDGKSLVDLPGYGFAKVPGSIKAHWQKTLPIYLQERKSLIGIIIVVDIRRSLTELDMKMLDWFAPRQRPIHLLLTKSDKFSKDKALRTLKEVKNQVEANWGIPFKTECSAQLFSSLKKQGIDEAEDIIQKWLSSNKNNIPNSMAKP